MSEQEIQEIVWQVAKDSATHGPGWAQEGVVLRASAIGLPAAVAAGLICTIQQLILDAWHDLFLQKKLAWGYDLDNPNSPFFHVR